MLVLTWIKDEPLPGGLVDDILKALKLERESIHERVQRITANTAALANSALRRSALQEVEQLHDDELDADNERYRDAGERAGSSFW